MKSMTCRGVVQWKQVIFLSSVLVGLSSCGPGPEEEADRRRHGFHCLSVYAGSHPKLVSQVKDSLRDPESFDHIETKTTVVSAEGTHEIIMRYRARNGFGGTNIETARGVYRNDDCSLSSWRAVQ